MVSPSLGAEYGGLGVAVSVSGPGRLTSLSTVLWQRRLARKHPPVGHRFPREAKSDGGALPGRGEAAPGGPGCYSSGLVDPIELKPTRNPSVYAKFKT